MGSPQLLAGASLPGADDKVASGQITELLSKHIYNKTNLYIFWNNLPSEHCCFASGQGFTGSLTNCVSSFLSSIQRRTILNIISIYYWSGKDSFKLTCSRNNWVLTGDILAFLLLCHVFIGFYLLE